ncbi:putative 16.5 kDa protein [Human adenovirus 41]|uniref:Putative 16.5 kDa protein n=1 Tax=Human adenovirus F serotype 41 TaxID=10524 RepID=A0A7U3NID8_ADE41|nr:putative 16.5 kDa protein [Human adenovirus 41]
MEPASPIRASTFIQFLQSPKRWLPIIFFLGTNASPYHVVPTAPKETAFCISKPALTYLRLFPWRKFPRYLKVLAKMKNGQQTLCKKVKPKIRTFWWNWMAITRVSPCSNAPSKFPTLPTLLLTFPPKLCVQSWIISLSSGSNL